MCWFENGLCSDTNLYYFTILYYTILYFTILYYTIILFCTTVFQKQRGDKTKSKQAPDMKTKIARLTKAQLNTIRASANSTDPKPFINNVINLFRGMQVLLSVSAEAEANDSSKYVVENEAWQELDARINTLCQSRCHLAFTIGGLHEEKPAGKARKLKKMQRRCGQKFAKIAMRKNKKKGNYKRA